MRRTYQLQEKVKTAAEDWHLKAVMGSLSFHTQQSGNTKTHNGAIQIYLLGLLN